MEELKEQEEALQSYLDVLEINTTAIKAAADEKEPMIGVCSRAPILHDRNVDFLKIEVSLSFFPLLFSIFIQKQLNNNNNIFFSKNKNKKPMRSPNSPEIHFQNEMQKLKAMIEEFGELISVMDVDVKKSKFNMGKTKMMNVHVGEKIPFEVIPEQLHDSEGTNIEQQEINGRTPQWPLQIIIEHPGSAPMNIFFTNGTCRIPELEMNKAGTFTVFIKNSKLQNVEPMKIKIKIGEIQVI